MLACQIAAMFDSYFEVEEFYCEATLLRVVQISLNVYSILCVKTVSGLEQKCSSCFWCYEAKCDVLLSDTSAYC